MEEHIYSYYLIYNRRFLIILVFTHRTMLPVDALFRVIMQPIIQCDVTFSTMQDKYIYNDSLYLDTLTLVTLFTSAQGYKHSIQ